MANIVNYRLRITLSDSRILTGQMLAFDKHMNLVLADCEEFRKINKKSKDNSPDNLEQKRTLGLVILRGETIVSMSIDGPPPPADSIKARGLGISAGVGIGRVSLIQMLKKSNHKTNDDYVAYGSWFTCCSSSNGCSYGRSFWSSTWCRWSCSWCKYPFICFVKGFSVLLEYDIDDAT